jgi:quercetin dioxygenase-like cupin family protein
MKYALPFLAFLFAGAAYAEAVNPIAVTEIMSATKTATGGALTLPSKNPKVIVSTYVIQPGAKLPVHKHIFARYAYVEDGDLRVTQTDTAKTFEYKKGDVIIEMTGEWHTGENIGSVPVKLLVFDQVEDGTANTVLKTP